ncbi:MAG: (2Fe-2S)-binding protein [Candidatus Latescibacteria bacterium]|nr:(2Fe-2S)-binding protein [bacterium]MCB9514462.1 (2Fe-2S)-binding protein [Candidatus Latescibacterota bacterium]MCB9517266.1 (2Fe-2S)-binding protein [Candidatus Latescibacterota bacterium]
MSETLSFSIDGKALEAQPGETILKAAARGGVYIPRLCAFKDLSPFGSCRVCTVLVNGRAAAACTQPVSEGMVVESDTEAVNAIRRDMVDMLFVEGNHYCMFCEKSGNCELQAMAYRLGITAPRFPYLFPEREVDMSHPDLYIDRNRCILCARCIRASREWDGKQVFEFEGRGHTKRLTVNAVALLAETDAAVSDRAARACPVGALLPKREGYAVPVGQRLYDHAPIGTDIEQGTAVD